MQNALDGATTASILGFAAAMVVVYCVRDQRIAEGTGIALLVGCAGIVLIGAVLGALRRIPAHLVANRIDRASGLADRIATAHAFELSLSRGVEADQDTIELMRAAVRDAVRAAPRADVAAATPFRRPTDARAALAFGVVGLLLAGLIIPVDEPPDAAGVLAVDPDGPRIDPNEAVALGDDDLDYTRDLLKDLERTAEAEQDEALRRYVDQIDALLQQAEKGELTKEQLLEELAKAEQRYMDGSPEDLQENLADLKKTGQELKKEPISKELGEALEKGDLEKARQEMEKLAQKLENQELSDKDRQKLAKALEQASEKFDKREEQRKEQLEKELAERQREVKRLKKELDETKDEQEQKRLSKRLQDKKSELKKLEREKERREQSAQRRQVKQLHRNMKESAQDMRQQGEKNQRQAARKMRDIARNTGEVDADRRKMKTQQKVASQMGDLKEALRRAKQQKSGQRDLFGKNRKKQDFEQRARGGQGSRGAWRPGQGQGQGQGQPGGQQPGGQGQQPGGDSYGDGHDPNLMGDATAKTGNTKDEQLAGKHGKGPSVRETVLSAAQKGFANKHYEQVYTQYKDIVEEVMRSEKVPSGYKYYVKRYFNAIKPHSMD